MTEKETEINEQTKINEEEYTVYKLINSVFKDKSNKEEIIKKIKTLFFFQSNSSKRYRKSIFISRKNRTRKNRFSRRI